VLGVVGVLVWFYLRGRFEHVDGRFDEAKHDTNRRFDEMKQDTNRRFDEVKQEMDRRFEQNERQHERFAADIAAARSDLTQIALILGARSRPEANQA
jgi:hypothetical protein